MYNHYYQQSRIWNKRHLSCLLYDTTKLKEKSISVWRNYSQLWRFRWLDGNMTDISTLSSSRFTRKQYPEEARLKRYISIEVLTKKAYEAVFCEPEILRNLNLSSNNTLLLFLSYLPNVGIFLCMLLFQTVFYLETPW